MSIANLITDKPQSRSVVSEKTKSVAKSMRNVMPKNAIAKMPTNDSISESDKVVTKSYDAIKDKTTPPQEYQANDEPVVTQQPTSISKMFSEILNLLKSDRENVIRTREMQRATREERRNSEKRDHEKFIRILRAYTGVKETPIEGKEFGLWDMIKSFVSGIFDTLLKPLKWLFDSSILKWIAKFATPAALGIALLAFSKEISPGTLFDKDGNPTEDYRKTLVKDKNNFMRPFGSTEASLVEMIESDTSSSKKQSWEQENEKGAKLFPDEATAIKDKYGIVWNEKNIINKANIDTMVYKEPPNQSFRPKYKYDNAPGLNASLSGKVELPASVAPSTAGAGRGSAAASEYWKNVTPAVPMQTPAAENLNRAVQENLDLQAESMSSQSVAQPIVTNNVSGSTVDDIPVSTQPKIRDDVPILKKVFESMKASW